MTKEEAKSFLIAISYDLGNMAVEDLSEKDGEKMREAIKALEQQPCEDCVSRQALIEKATSWDKHFADSERCVSLTDIQGAPPVTPQPKRGKWIEVEVHNCHATLKCSECDRVIGFTYTFGEYSYEAIKKFYPYCHCGTKMEQI